MNPGIEKLSSSISMEFIVQLDLGSSSNSACGVDKILSHVVGDSKVMQSLPPRGLENWLVKFVRSSISYDTLLFEVLWYVERDSPCKLWDRCE